MSTDQHPEPFDLEAARAQLEAERAAFRRERATARAREQVIAYAERAGVRKPALVWTALSRDLDALDLDLDGDQGARNYIAPIRELLTEIPELLGR